MNEVPFEYLQAGGYFGPEFTSVFFFGDVFWRVVIPLMFGATSYDILNSLAVMPPQIRARLLSDSVAGPAYKEHWIDCLDYDFGCNHLGMQPLTGDAGEFLASARRDLLSAISDLSQMHPNSNAMLSSRVATEKAMKAFLAYQHGYTERALRKQFSHDLIEIAEEICRVDPASELSRLRSRIGAFASYSDRYANKQYSRPELWRAYRCAQFAMSSLMRVVTPASSRALASF